MNASELNNILAGLKRLGAELPTVPSTYPLAAPTFAPGATESAIESVETSIGMPLPNDYRAFLLACGRIVAMDVHNGYDLLSPSLVLSIRAQAGVPRAVRDDSQESAVIPVAADGGGNLFLLEMRHPHRIWKWNHDLPADESGVCDATSGTLTAVAEGFTAFLLRVVEDWEHFVADDHEWPYLSG